MIIPSHPIGSGPGHPVPDLAGHDNPIIQTAFADKGKDLPPMSRTVSLGAACQITRASAEPESSRPSRKLALNS